MAETALPLNSLPGRPNTDRPQRIIPALLALALIVPAPTLGELAGLQFWPGTALGTLLYIGAKCWIVLVPLIWWRCIDHGAWSWSPPKRGGFAVALIAGVVIAAVMLGVYAIALHNHWLASSIPRMRAQAARTHLDVWWVFLVFVLVISSANALMEEFVWRWFVYRQCAALMPSALAVLAAAALFTVHHTAALCVQATAASVLLGSLGVFLGGLIWSWMYQRYQSIWPGFVCHILADAGMFAIGWHMIYRARG